MITIILAVLLGVVFTLLSLDNSQETVLYLFDNVITLPLYIILAITFLLGTLATSIFSIFDWTSTFIDIKKKENNYDNALKINEDLRKNIQRLNQENSKLAEDLKAVRNQFRERSYEHFKDGVKGFFHKLTHPNSEHVGHTS